jgi:PTH1 family peptidyl-tRNA hydrolase
MKLIIGLGNPDAQYALTRHNFGFMALDYFQKNQPVFSAWQEKQKFEALLDEGEIEGEKIILAKPRTMMNLSGKTVKTLADFYQIAPQDIVIIHDDMDLPLGALRLSQGSSAAGHKGVDSVIGNLGTKNFVRLRLGIHPLGQTFFTTFFRRLAFTKKFVLQKFSHAELPLVEEAIKKANQAILLILKDDLPKAQNQFN